jgi:hypothetical protein
MRSLPILMILIASFAIATSAQAVYTPKADSAERKAILAALRVPVEKDFKQKIVFVIGDFNSNGSWAYIGGSPQVPGGGNPSLAGTQFEEYGDAYDHNFFGLLRKTGGKWRVVTYAIGCTDVCWLDWATTHKAPKAIFPGTE